MTYKTLEKMTSGMLIKGICMLWGVLLICLPTASQVHITVTEYVEDRQTGYREYLSLDPVRFVSAYRHWFAHDSTQLESSLGLRVSYNLESCDIRWSIEEGDTVFATNWIRDEIAKREADTLIIDSGDTLSVLQLRMIAAELRMTFCDEQSYVSNPHILKAIGRAVFLVRLYRTSRLPKSLLSLIRLQEFRR